MSNDNSQIWFPEPNSADETYAKRDEHTLDWLARCTNDRAKECRRFLNEHITKFPAENQRTFVHNLRPKWHSTLFEIIVARLLQELGARIDFETNNSDGKCPDFLSRFPDVTVVVEATVPVINGDLGKEVKKQVRLSNYVESKIPDGWSVGVVSLPKIGHQDSLKEFESVVDEMLKLDPPKDGDEAFEISREITSGIITLHIVPKSSGGRLHMEGFMSYIDNTKERIKGAIKKKRRQVRGSDYPVVLAISASGLSSDYEDYDLALFGGDTAYVDLNGHVYKHEFLANGLLNQSGNDEPTFAGVLAFLDVGFHFVNPPILYCHPRFSGTLPQALKRFERRMFNAVEGRIEVIPAEPDSMPDLHMATV